MSAEPYHGNNMAYRYGTVYLQCYDEALRLLLHSSDVLLLVVIHSHPWCMMCYHPETLTYSHSCSCKEFQSETDRLFWSSLFQVIMRRLKRERTIGNNEKQKRLKATVFELVVSRCEFSSILQYSIVLFREFLLVLIVDIKSVITQSRFFCSIGFILSSSCEHPRYSKNEYLSYFMGGEGAYQPSTTDASRLSLHYKETLLHVSTRIPQRSFRQSLLFSLLVVGV